MFFKKLYQKLDEINYNLRKLVQYTNAIRDDTLDLASCVEPDEHKIKTKRQVVQKK